MLFTMLILINLGKIVVKTLTRECCYKLGPVKGRTVLRSQLKAALELDTQMYSKIKQGEHCKKISISKGMEIKKLKAFIQSANINFLFGSGLSQPYLSTLDNIETWLTELAKDEKKSDNLSKIIKASIYKEYFTKVALPNYNPDKENKDYKIVIDGYKNFLTIWNDMINKRANRLLSKQVNIFTTNIDTLVENAAELAQIEFNDGFKGSIKQVFDER